MKAKYRKCMSLLLAGLVLQGMGMVACQSKSSMKPATGTRKVYKWEEFCMGVDLSYVNQIEDNGGVYKDSLKKMDPFTIFRNHGANAVRVRLWVNPSWQLPVTGGKLYSDLPDVEKTIRRAKENGMVVNLDLHYSDDWADPQKQNPPAAWQGLSFEQVKDSVYQYTLSVLNYLSARQLTPEMIQIGNETNPGMLFPYGQINNGDFKGFADLLKSGIRAVRDFSAGAVTIKPKIILHVAQLQDAGWWTRGVISQQGVTDFDILGLSHYSKWSQVNDMKAITDTIQALTSRYGKTVMIVETAYPYTANNFDSYNNLFGPGDALPAYPLTMQGQFQYMKDLVQAVINGGGKGIMYWEPAWITSPMRDRWGQGSSWENNALFDWNGNVVPAMDYMNSVYQFK